MKKYDGKVIDINATALKLQGKCFDLLAYTLFQDVTVLPFW